MRGAPRDEKGRARERKAGEPRLHRPPRQSFRQEKHAEAGERDVQQIDDVEGADDAEQRLQRQREDIREDGVVVEAEIGARVEREDAVSEERRSMTVDELVAEDPGVPDVDARVAAGLSRQMREQTYRQRPRLQNRDEHERGESACALPPGGRWHAASIL